jgi:hypothetical protein
MVTERIDGITKDAMEQEAACLATACIIRKKSETGELTLRDEISGKLYGLGLLKSGEDGMQFEMETILKKTLEGNADLKEVRDKDGLPRFYSVGSMSEAYAGIFVKREEDPLLLIAEIVRENSETYPRPIPLDIFKGVPFEWTQEEILTCLRKMGDHEEYQDIAQTTTSVGTIFLYSSRYLEPDYASTLAEWLDVGQANNP